MKFPTLYYFIDLTLGTRYLCAIRNLGYAKEELRVVPVITRADLYSMRENGSSDSWLEDHVHGDHGEEQVRIVQAGPHTGNFCAPSPVYSIGIVTGDSPGLSNFSEIWVSSPTIEEQLTLTCPIEVILPGDVVRLFDPMSLA